MTDNSSPTDTQRNWPASAGVILASLFVIWHSAAILIAPTPDSYLRDLLYPYFKPYVTLFHLDNYWGFFAPDPAAGRMLRYEIEDAKGKRHEFRLTEDLQRASPAFLRYTTLYFRMKSEMPLVLGQSMGAFLCRRHTDLAPRRVFFVLHAQQWFTPEDYLRGDRPLTPNYMQTFELNPVTCGSATS